MKTQVMGVLGFKMLVAALLAVLVLAPIGQPAAAGPLVQVDEPPHEVTLENGFRITFSAPQYDEAADTSTWTYTVEELPEAKDLSNWVLELPYCVEILDASPEPWESVHPDPNAQLSGIKWETGDQFEAGDFTLTVSGQWEIGETQVAAKGPDVAWGTIAGPVCETNQAPVAVDDELSTYQNWAINVPVLNNDFDPDGDPLYLEDFAASAEGGTVVREENGTLGDFTDDYLVYTPTVDFTGQYSFTYTVGDGSLTDQGLVTIQVLPPGEAPIANPDTFYVDETPFSVPAPGVLLNDQLLDYDPVDVILQDEPVSGTVTLGADGTFSYTQDTDFYGEDSFTYYLEANGQVSDVATVTLHISDEVKPEVDWIGPVAAGETQTVEEDQVVELDVQATDNNAVDRVEYFRWDPAAKEVIPLAQVSQAPYSVEISAADLQQGFNQVYAAAYDAAGNRSNDAYIWLYKEAAFVYYLPVTIK